MPVKRGTDNRGSTVITISERRMHYIGYSRKSEPLFVENFFGDCKTEFIEILHTIILEYHQHFCQVSTRSVANYVSVVKFKTTSQKMQYQGKIMQVILE